MGGSTSQAWNNNNNNRGRWTKPCPAQRWAYKGPRALSVFLSERRPVSVSHMNSAAADAQQINIWCVFSLFIIDEINSPLTSRERERDLRLHTAQSRVTQALQWSPLTDSLWLQSAERSVIPHIHHALLQKLSVFRSSQCDPVLLEPKCSMASQSDFYSLTGCELDFYYLKSSFLISGIRFLLVNMSILDINNLIVTSDNVHFWY